MTTGMVSKGLTAQPGPLPLSSMLTLVQCLPPEPSGFGRYLAVPMAVKKQSGPNETGARRHVGAALLSRSWRRVVVVGRRIRDVRMTRSSTQQDAEECCQASSFSHSDYPPFRGPCLSGGGP